MALSGNRGEWSEIYALLRIIADKELSAGDCNLNKIENLIFPVIKILRDESAGTYEYSYCDDIVVIQGNGEEFRISIGIFEEQAASLLSELKTQTDRTFAIPDVENFMNTFNCTSLKASSSVKSDIRIVIHDRKTGQKPELGFSIKSQIGHASTLLNAGKTTNFIYKISNPKVSNDKILKVNEIRSRFKLRDRLLEIYKYSGGLKFVELENKVFNNNLILIDSSLPNILAEMLLVFFTKKISKTVDLLAIVAKTNPLGYDLECGHPFYSYKIKRFLTDIALGMMPSRVWTGKLDATGGYLVIKEDGEILCYHIYNRNEFEEYLLNNTKLETASSSRHDFGTVYEVGEELFFKLNLQIRFNK